MREIIGDILYVNLTERRAWRESVAADLVTEYLGGRGVNAQSDSSFTDIRVDTDDLSSGIRTLDVLSVFSAQH